MHLLVGLTGRAEDLGDPGKVGSKKDAFGPKASGSALLVNDLFQWQSIPEALSTQTNCTMMYTE